MIESMTRLAAIIFLSWILFCVNSRVNAQSVDPNSRFACEWIGIAEYQDYRHDKSIRSSNPPVARFYIVCTLKGPPNGVGVLPVKYDFGNSGGSRKDKESKTKNWKLEDSMMPKKNSKWIIFLPEAMSRQGAYRTFQGEAGRLTYSKKNLDETLDGIEHSDPSARFNAESRQKLNALVELWKTGSGDQWAEHWH